jgi:hypothetical protein
MLLVVTYLWGSKYSPDDVVKLINGLDRGLEQDRGIVVLSDRPWQYVGPVPNVWVIPIPPEDRGLTKIRGCFARMRLFDPSFQDNLEILFDQKVDRIACVDLDVVVTGKLDPLFNRPEPFLILGGANSSNPCPYNGSIWMLRPGAFPQVWKHFSVEDVEKIPFFDFPDDQGWMHYKIPMAATWEAGTRSGIYAFQKPGWPDGNCLPGDARLVVFPGWRSPQQFRHLGWVRDNWR